MEIKVQKTNTLIYLFASLTREEYNTLRSIAWKKHKPMAALAREAIEKYLHDESNT